MKFWHLIAILAFTTCIIAQDVYEQYGFKFRNYIIPSFKADSTKYTQAFPVGEYENIVVQAMFQDTAHAGLGGDSCAFSYSLQPGFIVYNSSGLMDTAWDPKVILIDTVNATAATFRNLLYMPIQTDGTYQDSAGVCDSTSVTGFATSRRGVVPYACMLARVVVKGMTGNRIGKFIKCQIQVYQRKSVKTSDQAVIER